MANDSIINALLSIEKRFDEYDAAHPSSAPPAGTDAAAPVTPPTLASRTAAHDMDDLSDLGEASSGSDDDDDSDDDDAAAGED
jgi:hypothetical protein